MMNKNFNEQEEAEFNEWLSKMYWEWYFASAIEKREIAEGEND